MFGIQLLTRFVVLSKVFFFSGITFDNGIPMECHFASDVPRPEAFFNIRFMTLYEMLNVAVICVPTVMTLELKVPLVGMVIALHSYISPIRSAGEM